MTKNIRIILNAWKVFIDKLLKLNSLILSLQKVKILNHSILRLVTGKAIPGSLQRQYLISLEYDMVSEEIIPPMQQCHWKCVQ